MNSNAVIPQKFLAWDTSSVTGVVVAFEMREQQLRIVAEWSLSLETSKHSERLLWTIDTVLQSAGWKLQDLSGLAVGIGPGSFTGLRIGITTARMLAAQLKLPVVPISSLAILARGVSERLEEVSSLDPQLKKDIADTLVIVSTDATKGEWFNLIGAAKNTSSCIIPKEGDLPGSWGQDVTEQTLSCSDLMELAQVYLKKHSHARWIAVGQSVERYPNEFQSLPVDRRILEASRDLNRMKPSTLARLASEGINRGLVCDFAALKPRYLRASEAEVKLKKGLLKVSPTESALPGRGGIA